MKKFTIAITETLQRRVQVSAENYREAMKMVERQYNNEEIVLNENDYQGVEFEPMDYQEEEEDEK